MLRWFKLDLRLKHLAIVSPGREEGRTYLAANLAVVFSQLGERTLLIDADMRHPRQHVLFGLPNRGGLSSLLAGRAGADVIELVAPLTNLSVLPAGPQPPNPQELLGRPVFQNFLAELDKEFDVVIIDTPACLRCVDGGPAQPDVHPGGEGAVGALAGRGRGTDGRSDQLGMSGRAASARRIATRHNREALNCHRAR
jgi:Mrp family chromosome partitioning ATPase